MTPSARGWGLSGAVLLMALLAMAPCGAQAGAPPETTGTECELGITLALTGEPARAESVFLSLLSHSPRDPRAYNNLGNLRLLKGDPAIALVFYEQALAADSADAGIVLNQATALLLLGDEDAAEERANVGVRMAGGMPSAASLLGLRYTGPNGETNPKGAEHGYLTQEEVLSMLRAVAGRVPSDSIRARSDGKTIAKSKKRAPVWRTAGPRASDADAPATLAYWKR